MCRKTVKKKKSLFLYSFGDGYGHFHSYLGCAWLGLKMENNKQPGNKVQIDRKFRSFRQKKKKKKTLPKSLDLHQIVVVPKSPRFFLVQYSNGFLETYIFPQQELPC